MQYCVYLQNLLFLSLRVGRTSNQISFYPRDVVSAVYATAKWLGGWLGVHHMPVLYQNG